jgi:hypothetical protein
VRASGAVLARAGFPCAAAQVPEALLPNQTHPESPLAVPVFRSPRLYAALAALSFVPWLLLGAFQARAGTAVRLDLKGLVDSAASCLEARVLASRVELDLHGRPCTRLSLSVTRDLIAPSAGSLDVRIPGGILPDGSGLVLAGMPSFAPGEEILLFLSEESTAGLRVPVGLAQGKFRIVRDARGVRTLLREEGELELFDPASSTRSQHELAAAYDYAAAMAEIQAAVARRRAAPAPSKPGAK